MLVGVILGFFKCTYLGQTRNAKLKPLALTLMLTLTLPPDPQLKLCGLAGPHVGERIC